MRNICRRIVGDNLKGEMALFSFPSTSGGEELSFGLHTRSGSKGC